MFLSTAALRNQPILFFAVAALMLFGAYSYFALPAREDPAIVVKTAVVQTTFPGLSAAEVELLITKPLEEAIETLPEIKEITSTSMDGVSIIKPTMRDEFRELEGIFDQLSETVAETVPQLPEGASTPIVDDDFGDVSVITLALSGEGYDNARLFDYAQHLRDRLITVPGTNKVDLLGVRQQTIYVEYDNAVLAQSGISPGEIAAALGEQNIIRPGGIVDRGGAAFTLRPSGDFVSIDAVRQTLIRSAASGNMFALADIAEVSSGYEDPPRQLVYFNGREAIMLAIAMQDGESVLSFSERAIERIDEIRETLPLGLKMEIATYEAPKVEKAVYGVSFNMLQTLAIVLGFVILFLGVRTGLIVGSIIPAVILATIALFGFFEISLQRMSLATIIISLGLLVDNGIVIAEDYKRRLEELGDRDEAIAATSRELAFPLASSSLTTIFVFLPLLIAQTASSEYTRSITQVIIISLTVSWFFAMTVTTTLCHKFIKTPEEQKDEPEATGWKRGIRNGWVTKLFDRFTDRYARLLRFVLGHRWKYVGLIIALMLGAQGLSTFIPTAFFPDSDTPQTLIYVELPAGTTSRTTDKRVQEMVEVIRDQGTYPAVESVAAYVGFGGPRFVLSLPPVDPAPNRGFIVLNMKDIDATKAIIPQLRDDFLNRFPDVNARVSRMYLGPEDPNVIQVQMQGPDADYIHEQSKKLEDILGGVDGMIDIWSNWYNRTTDLEVIVDQQRARIAGVTSADISASLARHVIGEPVTVFRDGDEIYPVTMRANEQGRTSLDGLETVAVYPASGGASVPLGQVATISPSSGFAFIQREDMSRTVTVEGRNLTKSPEDMAVLIQPKLDELNAQLAPGHRAVFDGVISEASANNSALAATGPLILTLIIGLLIIQFGGFKRPLVVLLGLPAITIGAFTGLFVMGATFGFMVILALFALAGIIVNNSIVLVDRMDIERGLREEGAGGSEREPDKVDELEAVIRGCRRRFRPVVMTTLTTIIGLLPLLLSGDALFYGFAGVIVFGLGIGTFILSLGLTPILYCLFFGIEREDSEKKELSDASDTDMEGASGMKHPSFRILAIAVIGLTAGCTTLGPDYAEPEVPLAGQLSTLSDTSLLAAGMAIDEQWWNGFNDPLLNQLLDDARTRNFTIEAAAARIEEARAFRRLAGAGGMPVVGALARGESQKGSTNTNGLLGPPPGAPSQSELFQLGLSASWELDLLGKIARRKEAADARLALAQEDRRGIVMMVLADTASAYVELRSVQRQIAVARTNIDVATKTTELTMLLQGQQLVSEFDLVRVRAEERQSRSALPSLQAAERSQIAALAALTGRTPDALVGTLGEVVPLAFNDRVIPIGLPSELVRRRPDLRAAERRLAAETADVGAAVAELYPSFSLTGMVGAAATSLGNLFGSGSDMWSFGSEMNWPIFSGGAGRAQVDAEQTGADIARAEYRGAVVAAFADVEQALSSYVYSDRRVATLRETLGDREHAFELAKLRAANGLDSALTLIDTQRALTATRAELAQAEGDRMNAIVGSYRALGGGWNLGMSEKDSDER